LEFYLPRPGKGYAGRRRLRPDRTAFPLSERHKDAIAREIYAPSNDIKGSEFNDAAKVAELCDYVKTRLDTYKKGVPEGQDVFKDLKERADKLGTAL
jgi:hypothetical protein